MCCILIVAFVYFFTAVGVGVFVNQWKAIGRPQGWMAALLSGTLLLTVYFNICSLFFAANYYTLLPPLLLAIVSTVRYGLFTQLATTLRQWKASLNAVQLFIATLCLLVVALFTIVPPYNTDSSGYHFLSILWNERFGTVPGLANLFPQFGYNSSFFVLSAPFSFTSLTGQSIYAINPVLTGGFMLWWLKRIFLSNGPSKIVYLLVLTVLLRQLPINLASPSADTLASVLVLYVLFRAVDESDASGDKYAYLLLLSVFSVVIKLSTLPLLLVAFIPFFFVGGNKTRLFRQYVQLLPLALLIVIPWLVRNVLLSGYLIFPFPSIDLFTVDWKVPLQVAIEEKLHITQAARMIGDDWLAVSHLPAKTWLPLWIKQVWNDNHFNFVFVLSGLASPALVMAVFIRLKSKAIYLLPAICVAYVGVLFWMFTSPDIRFGYHFLLPAIVLPWLFLVNKVSLADKAKRAGDVVFNIACIGLLLYYVQMGVQKLQPFPVSSYMAFPLKSDEYAKRNDLTTFRSVMLNDHIRLYIQDSMHHSINAPLPSCYPYRPGIRLRGHNLQDGFKTQP